MCKNHELSGGDSVGGALFALLFVYCGASVFKLSELSAMGKPIASAASVVPIMLGASLAPTGAGSASLDAFSLRNISLSVIGVTSDDIITSSITAERYTDGKSPALMPF